MNYKRIYDELISKAHKRIINSTEYTEKHHIEPRCIGGTNDPNNIVVLFPEEHLLAHLLLVKIHPLNEKLVYAANAMSNGFNKVNRINIKQYGWFKRKHSKIVSKNTKGKVTVVDLNDGKTKQVTKKEFDLNDQLVGPSKGKVNVYDTEKGKFVSVSTKEYYDNKDRYLSTGKGKTIVWNTDLNKKEYINIDSINDEIHIKYVTCINTTTGETLSERSDVFHLSDHLIGIGTGFVPVVDKRDGTNKRISLETFLNNKKKYQHKSQGNISVVVKETEETKQITKEEFYQNRELYYTINERFTNCIDTRTMINVRVSINDYKKYNYYVSNKSKKYNIYDSSGQLMFKTFGDFDIICDNNGLPKNALKESRKTGKPIYLNSGSNESRLKKRGWLKYRGWYVKEGV